MKSAPLILFAPGAGAPSTSAWMTRWAKKLSAFGDVVRFDYSYMAEGKGAPSRLPVLIAEHRAALDKAKGRKKRRVVLAGKSMGSRMGCHVSLETRIDALVCFGYPLVGQSGKMRDEVLLALSTPILFVQGTRDPLCPLLLLEHTRRRMTAPSALFVVEDGDHSLDVPKRALEARGLTREELDERILGSVASFLGVQ